MNLVYLSIGSNIGDKKKYIEKSVEKIGSLKETKVLEISPLLKTKPLEIINQPDFINAIIKIKTDLKPLNLLYCIQNIEKLLGRSFRYKKGPREIDIDILIYENLKLCGKYLTIPHPAIKTRPFILQIFESMKDKDYKDYI